MQQVAFVAADPVLAGLCVVTGVHFVSLMIQSNQSKDSQSKDNQSKDSQSKNNQA
jgi:hypothetical protein